jgi:hypothetical protein
MLRKPTDDQEETMDQSFVAAQRKRLLRRGRALLRGSAGLASLSEVHRQELADIHAALERIERGLYGRCVGCPAEIEMSRLDAEPAAERCMRCCGSAPISRLETA